MNKNKFYYYNLKVNKNLFIELIKRYLYNYQKKEHPERVESALLDVSECLALDAYQYMVCNKKTTVFDRFEII